MKKITLFTVLAILSSIASYAQDTTAVKPKRAEIAIDLSGIFTRFIRTDGFPGIFFRVYNTKTNSAWRFKINFNGNNSITEQRPTNIPANGNNLTISRPNTSFGATLQIGKQWEKMYKKMSFYGGIDLICGYSNTQNEQTYTIPDISINIQEYNTSGYTLGVAPLVGISYYVSKRFKLSAETNLSAIYNNAVTTSLNKWTYNPNNSSSPPDQISENKSSTSGLSYSFSPLSMFAVSYLF